MGEAPSVCVYVVSVGCGAQISWRISSPKVATCSVPLALGAERAGIAKMCRLHSVSRRLPRRTSDSGAVIVNGLEIKE